MVRARRRSRGRRGENEVDAAVVAASGGPDALFSIDVTGAKDGEAVLNQRLEIAYEAALPGYLAYLGVSSHGDLTLYRDPARCPN